MSAVRSGLPAWIKDPLRALRDAVTAVPCYGVGRVCPVCGRAARRFRRAGPVPRDEAQCIHCGALERHRLAWLYLSRRTSLLDGSTARVLHVAPEPCIEAGLRARVAGRYVTADLAAGRAMVRTDLTGLPFADRTFDVVFCSHVLEHVADDRQALREIRRVLTVDGWALLQVPIAAGHTLDDPAVVDPRERRRLFGQDDHVRRYGRDFVDRLREAGFSVVVTTVTDLAEGDEAVTMGLTGMSGEIYHCTPGGAHAVL